MSFFRLWLIVLVMMACVEAQAHARGAPNFAPGWYLCADNGPILGNNSYSDAAHRRGIHLLGIHRGFCRMAVYQAGDVFLLEVVGGRP
jgi:hypothetical protein